MLVTYALLATEMFYYLADIYIYIYLTSTTNSREIAKITSERDVKQINSIFGRGMNELRMIMQRDTALSSISTPGGYQYA